ncbi:MAG: bifunctional chorismate mutase/prephenate dehydratase [Christensenellales bacterium]|jgi:chorismate mutase/prephenate dehydratase
MDLEVLRRQIDEIDEKIVTLYKARMETSAAIAECKRENALPVYDPSRERKLLYSVSEMAGEEFEAGVRVLFSVLMELSKSYQNRLLLSQSGLAVKMKDAVENTPNLFPERAIVACQGTEGAYSQAACEKLFSLPNIMYFNNFESIFSAVDSGLCRYGVLPIENSSAGSVRHVYDSMIKKKFYIVRSVRMQVNHVLLTKDGVRLEDVKEIISHEQALAQCSEYLKNKNVKITVCENTAFAAKTVAESERNDIAAISSRSCAELYGLRIADARIQNTDSNFTRFVCISKKLEIYPGADRTSMMMVIPHKPGSLYRILARFFAHGVNLTKLESRPIIGRDFEFMFYFDVDASVYSPALTQLLCELETELEEFSYLGSYLEVI